MMHFFTLVLDGMPFIRWHYGQFCQLKCDWKWTVVEGVAAPVADTSWCKPIEPRLSNDGTSDYLDFVSSRDDRVKWIKQPRWRGKAEMVNTALGRHNHECILMQVDVDELWTAEQIDRICDLFSNDKARTHAFYYCRYFPAFQVETKTKNTYGNNEGYEWIRTWRYFPCMKFKTHEPPIMTGSRLRPNAFKHKETLDAGLQFQHFAYWFRHQAEFKSSYYGYDDAVKHWWDLSENTKWPAKLKEFYPWVKDETVVDRASGGVLVDLIV